MMRTRKELKLPRAAVTSIASVLSHRYQVIVRNRVDVLGLERQHGGGSTGRGYELHLEPVRLVHFHHRARRAHSAC